MYRLIVAAAFIAMTVTLYQVAMASEFYITLVTALLDDKFIRLGSMLLALSGTGLAGKAFCFVGTLLLGK